MLKRNRGGMDTSKLQAGKARVRCVMEMLGRKTPSNANKMVHQNTGLDKSISSTYMSGW